MQCWKYMAFDWGVKSVMDGWFRLSRHYDFNDPLDCSAIMIGDLSEEIKKSLGIDGAERLAEAIRDSNYIKKYLRFFCVSEVRTAHLEIENLMWSHYADKARGIRVLLDFNDSWIDENMLTPVEYGTSLPIALLPTLCEKNSEQWTKQYFLKVVNRKSSCWEYEKEHRVAINLNDLQSHKVEVRFSENNVFLKIPHKNIIQVDFGYDADELKIAHIATALRNNALTKDIKLRRAVLKPGEWDYGYRYEEVEDLSNTNGAEESHT